MVEITIEDMKRSIEGYVYSIGQEFNEEDQIVIFEYLKMMCEIRLNSFMFKENKGV